MDTPLSLFITELRTNWEALKFDKIAIIIFDSSQKQMYNINTAQKAKGSLWIIFDEEHIVSPLNVQDAYYCDRLADLQSITDFVLHNPEVYYEPEYSEDALNKKTLSLDELIENNYNI